MMVRIGAETKRTIRVGDEGLRAVAIGGTPARPFKPLAYTELGALDPLHEAPRHLIARAATGACRRSASRRAARRTAGELWAREQLELLRDARFAPRAVARFLVASQRRANAERRARPATARRMRRWVAAGAGAWAALALAGREPFRRRAGAFAAWWALTWLMLDWHIGMVETEDGRPRNLGAADACTLVRVWLVPAAADAPAPWMCALAFATDGLDGRLARASEPTRIGRDLEGLADCGVRRRGAARRGAQRLARPRARRAASSRGSAPASATRVVVWFGSARRARPARAARRARHDAGARRRASSPPGSAAGALAGALVLGGAGWSARRSCGRCAASPR